MEKKAPRVITGWRQVVVPKPKLRKPRAVPGDATKPEPTPRLPVADAAAKDRWDAEGGKPSPAAARRAT